MPVMRRHSPREPTFENRAERRILFDRGRRGRRQSVTYRAADSRCAVAANICTIEAVRIVWFVAHILSRSARLSQSRRAAGTGARTAGVCAGESRVPMAYSGAAASVWLDGRLVRRAGADARGCGVGLPGGGQVPGGGREAEDRHVAVDGLVFAGPDLERLVPDPDVA